MSAVTEDEKIASYGRLVTLGMAELAKSEKWLADAGIDGVPTFSTTFTTKDGETWTLSLSRGKQSEEADD